MEWWLIAVFLSSCSSLSHDGQGVTKAFTVMDTGTSFQVLVGTTLLMDHESQRASIFVGKGFSTIKEDLGNFEIEEYIESRVPLPVYTITEDEFTTTVQLSASTDSQISCEIVLSTTSLHELSIEFTEYPAGYNRTWIRLHAEPEEYVYGGGEQFSYFDMRGHNYPIWTREQGVGRDYLHPVKYLSDVFAGGAGGDYHTTYFPQASFVSSRYFSCHVLGSAYMELDFKPTTFHELLVHGVPQGLVISVGSTMVDLLEKQSEYFGRQPVLPEWLSNGAVIGLQGGTDRMLEILSRAEDNGLSVAGMWIQDWSGSIYTTFGKRVYWNWEWNPEKYPGLDTEIIRLKEEKGVRLLAYITGHMIENGSIYNDGTGKGYFMKNENGDEYLIDFGEYRCATVDLTNPDARNWYKSVMRRNLIDFGFGGWMADFGEYIPVDSVWFNGETGLTMHNKFSVLWAQLNRELVEEAGKLGEIMFFMRAGGPGTQRYSVNSWAGDQNVDWSYSDGLASTIPAALSLGMSGFGLTHFDIGGYTTQQTANEIQEIFINLTMVRSEELFFRGAEYAVFTTMMRTHEGNRPNLNFQVYDQKDTIEQFAVLVEMFKVLSKYTWSVMEENSQTGIPVQRPLFLHYENDPETYTISYQYLLGRDLLVAPVVEEEKLIWSVYLPADDWRYLYDDTPYNGGEWITVPAPLGKPPVFYRAGSEWVETFKKVAAIANTAKDKLNCSAKDQCP